MWPAVTALFLGFRRRLSVIVTVLVVGILVVDVHRALLWEHGANFLLGWEYEPMPASTPFWSAR